MGTPSAVQHACHDKHVIACPQWAGCEFCVSRSCMEHATSTIQRLICNLAKVAQ